MSNILHKYFNTDKLQLAYHRVQFWSDKTVKDIVGLKAFGQDLFKNCNNLAEKILNNNYVPQPGFKFYVPKASETLRTKTMLNIEDAIVYQAIADAIAESAQSEMSQYDDFVFGSVLSPEVIKGIGLLSEENPCFYFFKPWTPLFKKFKESVLNSIQKDRVKYKFETDITGFFDSIPHYNLLIILSKKFNVEDEILDLLSTCFNVWSGTKESLTPGVGIPQGPGPSFFFANLLLHELDQIIISQGYKYYRYMDDIHIYGYSRIELVEVLLIIDKYTKGNGLSINSKKTRIEEINYVLEEEVIQKEIKKIDNFSVYNEIVELTEYLAEKEALSMGNIDSQIRNNQLTSQNYNYKGFEEIENEDESLNNMSQNLNELEFEEITDLNKKNLRIKFQFSDQSDPDSIICFKSHLPSLKDQNEIIDFWIKQKQEVESLIWDFFIDPKMDINELKLKETVTDHDFIELGIQYNSAFNGFNNYEVHFEPDDKILKFWLFVYKTMFWRANSFGIVLGLYKNSPVVKETLMRFYFEDHKYYEWVKYYILITISINNDLSDQELRQVYFKQLKNEQSDLVKISLYRLLYKHANNSQLKMSITNELKSEKNEVLKLIIADFNKNHHYSTLNMGEFLNKIGI